MNKKYLIWSIEHEAWWGPNNRGYVLEKEKAGLYSFEQASYICKQGNKYCEDIPNEAMVEYVTTCSFKTCDGSGSYNEVQSDSSLIEKKCLCKLDVDEYNPD